VPGDTINVPLETANELFAQNRVVPADETAQARCIRRDNYAWRKPDVDNEPRFRASGGRVKSRIRASAIVTRARVHVSRVRIGIRVRSCIEFCPR
jgi:hypothetical protein